MPQSSKISAVGAGTRKYVVGDCSSDERLRFG